MLKIELLGPFYVYRGNHLITAEEWRTDKNRDLLKILLTEPGRDFSQDELLERLWPEGDPKKTQKNLRARVSELRRILEPGLERGRDSRYIKTHHKGYSFDPEGCLIDVQEFLPCCEEGQRHEEGGDLDRAIRAYQDAVQLYKGDFLAEDFHKDWAIQPRERLRRSYLEVLRRLSNSYVGLGRYEQAISLCEQAAAIKPYREELYRKLMELHWKSGDMAAALAVYQRCKDILHNDLGVAPSEETEVLCRRIKQKAGEPTEQIRLRRLQEIETLLEWADPEKRFEFLLEKIDICHTLARRDEEAESIEEGLQLARELDEEKLGEASLKQYRLYRALGRFEEAWDAAEDALRLMERVGSRLGEVRALSCLGTAHLEMGQLDQALACYERAIKTCCEQGFADKEGTLLSDIALVYRMRGDHPKALEYYDRALSLHRKLENKPGEATVILNLGALFWHWGRLGEAQLHWEKAREMLHQLGERRKEAGVLSNLGSAYRAQGQLERALSCYEQAYRIRKAMNDRKGEILTLNNIGLVQENLGLYDKALDCYERAHAISKEIQEPRSQASALNNLGVIHRILGNYVTALKRLEQAYSLYKHLGELGGQAQVLLDLGITKIEQGEHEQALEYLDSAEKAFRGLGPSDKLMVTLSYRALAHLGLQNKDRALRDTGEVGELLQRCQQWEYKILASYNLFRVFSELDRPEEAQAHLKAAQDALMEQAAGIKDMKLRKSFLEKAKLNRSIAQAWQRLQG